MHQQRKAYCLGSRDMAERLLGHVEQQQQAGAGQQLNVGVLKALLRREMEDLEGHYAAHVAAAAAAAPPAPASAEVRALLAAHCSSMGVLPRLTDKGLQHLSNLKMLTSLCPASRVAEHFVSRGGGAEQAASPQARAVRSGGLSAASPQETPNRRRAGSERAAAALFGDAREVRGLPHSKEIACDAVSVRSG